jgi:hypothetical protein
MTAELVKDVLNRRMTLTTEQLPMKARSSIRTKLNSSSSFAINIQSNDVFISCYPSTGDELIERICCLLMYASSHSQIDRKLVDNLYTANDIHDNHLPFRIFKSNMPLSEISFEIHQAKYISTIRDPYDSLRLLYENLHTHDLFTDGRGWNEEPNLLEFIFSAIPGIDVSTSIASLYFSQLLSYWSCRHCKNMLLIPFEDLVANRSHWIPIIANYLGLPCTPELLIEITFLTGKSYMQANMTCMSEMWDVANPRLSASTFLPKVCI